MPLKRRHKVAKRRRQTSGPAPHFPTHRFSQSNIAEGSLVEACRMTAKCSSSCQVGSTLTSPTFPARGSHSLVYEAEARTDARAPSSPSRQRVSNRLATVYHASSSASTKKALGLKLWTPVSAVMPCSSDPLRLRHIILRFG